MASFLRTAAGLTALSWMYIGLWAFLAVVGD